MREKQNEKIKDDIFKEISNYLFFNATIDLEKSISLITVLICQLKFEDYEGSGKRRKYYKRMRKDLFKFFKFKHRIDKKYYVA